MYFNLKDGVSEEEFVEKSKEWLSNVEGRMEGARVGSMKLFRHHFLVPVAGYIECISSLKTLLRRSIDRILAEPVLLLKNLQVQQNRFRDPDFQKYYSIIESMLRTSLPLSGAHGPSTRCSELMIRIVITSKCYKPS